MILTQNRDRLFGGIVEGKMVLNNMEKIVHDERLKTADIRREIQLDEYVACGWC